MERKISRFIASIFLALLLFVANVAATVEITSVTEAADPVDISNDIEFIVEVLESDGETTASVEVSLAPVEPVDLEFDGTYWTGTLAASTIGTGTFSYDVVASGNAGNSDTASSDVTVEDVSGPIITDITVYDSDGNPVSSSGTIEYGDTFTITADVSDLGEEVDESSVALHVDTDGDGVAETITMTYTGSGSVYSTDVLATTDFDLGTYSFTITAADILGNEGTSDEDSGTTSFTIADTTGPVITDITVHDSEGNNIGSSESLEYGDTFTITADISDAASTVDDTSVEVTVYDTDGTTILATIPMEFSSGSEYATADIETTDFDLGTYSFTITAADILGNDATSDDTSGTTSFTIADTTDPTITASMDATSPLAFGTTVTVTATATDLLGVDADSLTFEIQDETGTTVLYGPFPMDPTANPDEYDVSFETTDSSLDIDIDYVYVVRATDTTGNEGTYSETFQITDQEAAEITDADVNGGDPVVCYEADIQVYASAEDNYDDPVDYVIINILDPSGFTRDYELSVDTTGSGFTHERTIGSIDIYDGDGVYDYGPYFYSFYAYDAAGNLPTGDTFDGTFIVADCSGPEFGTVTANDIVYGVDDLTITAAVADAESGVDDVSVEVYDAAGNLVDADVMTLTSGDDFDGTYEITFPTTDFTNLETYSFIITATNNDGFTEEYEDTFDVTDQTAPEITLSGSSSVTVEAGDEYTDEGATAVDDFDGDLTDEIETVNPVDTSVVATYTVTYDVSDSSGNEATQVTRTVDVVDTTAPVITVIGSDETVEAGSTYTDAGATATDNADGDLTDEIETDNPVDTAVVGTYTVTYTVTDSAGYSDTETRTVDVVDTTAPEITLLGDDPIHLELGESYSEPGATASDIVDGDLTEDIIIDSSSVDTSIEGEYIVTYDVTDSAGLSDTETRTVEVSDTIDPVIESVSLSATRVNEGDTITFTVTASDENGLATVELVTNGATYTMEDPEGDGTYTVDVDTTGFALDSYSYTITSTDGSGNTDSATGTYVVTIVSPMTVRILADKTSGEEDLDVSFASSVDEGGVEPLSYSWSFGDGDTDGNKNVRHVFTADGTYTVTLTVRDQYGNEGSASVVITVSEEASSNDPRNNIQITGLSIPNDVVAAGDVLEVSVDVENIGNSRLNDVSMTVFIPELGLWQRTTAEDIRTGDDESFTVGLDIPADVEPGIYDVRITVSNDDYSRVKHRDIVIE